MNKYITLLILSSYLPTVLTAQSTDTLQKTQVPSIFEKITKEVGSYKPDTTSVPNDKITKIIIELRSLKGGFNINEAIAFKLEEDRQKAEMPAEDLKKLADFFQTGNGKLWLDNAVIRIYREHFTYQELKQLVTFYKTSAGQKMAGDFPVIMLQSLAAAEMIKRTLIKLQK